MIDLNLEPRLRDAITRELEPGESVVFAETPQRRFFTPAAVGAMLFGIPWTGVSLLFISGGAGFERADGGAIGWFSLSGVPFVLIGLAMLSAPIWAYRASGTTAYVITDRRAITFVGGWRTTIRSFYPKDLTRLYRTQRADGSGDVVIDVISHRDSDGDRQSTPIGFVGVSDAKDTEDRLRKLAATAA